MASTLPNEILFQIFEELRTKEDVDLDTEEDGDLDTEEDGDLGTKEDVCNARRTCKSWAAAGGRYILFTVFLSKYLFDLKRLHDITKSLDVLEGVTTMVCDDSFYTNETSAAPRWTEVDLERPYLLDDPVRLADRIQWYWKMCEQELAVREESVQINLLMEALPRMRSLRRLVVTDCCGPPESYDRSRWTRYHETPFQRSGEWNYHSPMAQGWQTQRRPVASWQARTSPYHGFVNMITALSLTAKPIKELVIEGRIVGISHRIFQTGAHFHHLRNVFENLTVLELNLDPGQADPSWKKKP